MAKFSLLVCESHCVNREKSKYLLYTSFVRNARRSRCKQCEHKPVPSRQHPKIRPFLCWILRFYKAMRFKLNFYRFLFKGKRKQQTKKQPQKRHWKMSGNQAQIDQLTRSETKQSLRQRRWVILSIVTLFLLGLPLWFKLTEIYRAPLPSNFIDFLQSHQNIDVKVHNHVFVKSVDGLYFPDLARAVQIQVNSELNKLQQNNNPQERLIVDWNVTLLDGEPSRDDYVLLLELGASEGISVDPASKETSLFYTLESVKNNDLAFFITQTLLQHIFHSEIELFKLKNQKRNINSIGYSPNVHLSFKLLTGDGVPVDWEIDQALETYFSPVVSLFKKYANFTIDSEIKYFTDINLLNHNDVIHQSDLSTILDFSEWDISSNQFSYSTLNFILYFPSQKNSPLNFDFNHSERAFLIPQWGSVILNPIALESGTLITQDFLRPVLEVFTSELFTLLGLPKNPKSPSIRIDALQKFTIVNNLIQGIDSLSSLLKLSKSLQSISIPKTVQDNVQNALTARQSVVEKLANSDFNGALIESIKVAKHSELAFFDNEMVQQAFFPQEHKIAVYTPLLGPLALMCIMGLIRILKEIKLYKTKKD